MQLETSALTVFLYALLTAVATGFGVLPFLFVKRMPARWIGASNALAAGLMGGASIGLIREGVPLGGGRTLLGIALGGLAIVGGRHMLGEREVHWGELEDADARKILLILGVMTLHSFTEGVGVGVSFGGGEALGVFITAAIAVHNIPEGLAIGLVMVPRGTSPLKAAWWSVFSSLPQPLMAVPAFLLVALFAPVLPVGLGFAAGAMLWMIGSELIPEALETASRPVVWGVLLLSLIAMLLFQTLL